MSRKIIFKDNKSNVKKNLQKGRICVEFSQKRNLV